MKSLGALLPFQPRDTQEATLFFPSPSGRATKNLCGPYGLQLGYCHLAQFFHPRRYLAVSVTFWLSQCWEMLLGLCSHDLGTLLLNILQ